MRGRINKRRRGKLRTARMRRKVRATIAAGSIALSLVVVTSDVLLSRVVLDAGSEKIGRASCRERVSFFG